VFPAQQPTNMGEEETTSGIMWISVGLRKLVMYTVITGPLYNVVLKGEKALITFVLQDT